MKWISSILIAISLVGCLDTGRSAPKPPIPVVGNSLSVDLLANIQQESRDIAGVASSIADSMLSAKPLAPSDQEKAWEQSQKIRQKWSDKNAELIANAFKKSTSAAETAAVWKEIGKAYTLQSQ